jgi:hypothetical protein
VYILAVFRSKRCGFVLLATLWLVSGVTHAQERPAEAPQQRALHPSEVPLVWERWALFDPFVDPHENGIVFEYNEWRELETGMKSRGGTLALSREVSTIVGPWAATLRSQPIALRMLEGPTFAVGFCQYDLLGSLDFKVMRFGAGAGLLPISFDYAHGDFSVAIASPRAVASLSVKVGTLRIALGVATSYLPRISGRDHVIAQHVSLEFLAERPPQLKRRNHPLLIR